MKIPTRTWVAVLGLTAVFAFIVIIANANGRCRTAACHDRVYMKNTIRPYRENFLEPVGACESGGTRSLKTGLRAVSPGGTYRGRYQFNYGAWRGAGGRGDPIDAGWLQQAYRAVRWLKINGRQSWPNC